MSRQNRRLALIAPEVAAQLDQLQSAIRNLGDGLAAVFAAQQQEADQQEAERERAPEPERPTTIIEEASTTRCFRATEVAQRLGVHQQTIFRWVKDGKFPKGIRIGEARVIWTEAMIAEWLAEKQANPDGKRRLLPRERIKRERL